MPQLAKILAMRHGFKCTVLFAINRKTGDIIRTQDNIPGLELLEHGRPDGRHPLPRPARRADEAHCRLRRVGQAIVAMRTATHAFKIRPKTYAKYSFRQQGMGGRFRPAGSGRNLDQSSRAPRRARAASRGQETEPISVGRHGWRDLGTHRRLLRPPLPGDSQALVLGQVLTGMQPTILPSPAHRTTP